MDEKDPRAPRRPRRGIGRCSRLYDFLFFEASQEVWDACLSLLRPAPGDRVLDVGCGTGRLAIALANLVGAAGSVAAVDAAAAMCREALRQTARTALAERIHVERADAAALPFPADRFDGAVSALTLELLAPPQRAAAIRELRRVVKPGGRVVLAALADEVPAGANLRAYETMRRLLRLAPLGEPLGLRRLAQSEGLVARIGVRRRFLRLPVDILITEVPQG